MLPAHNSWRSKLPTVDTTVAPHHANFFLSTLAQYWARLSLEFMHGVAKTTTPGCREVSCNGAPQPLGRLQRLKHRELNTATRPGTALREQIENMPASDCACSLLRLHLSRSTVWNIQPQQPTKLLLTGIQNCRTWHGLVEPFKSIQHHFNGHWKFGTWLLFEPFHEQKGYIPTGYYWSENSY